MSILKKLYQKLAFRLYSVGKDQYEKYAEQMMFQRATVGEKTRFYPGSQIINLSNDKGKIQVGSNCHISGLMLIYSYGGSIKIGDNCSLSEHSRIVSANKVEIGNRVLIAHNVNIIDNISHPIDANLRHEDFMNSYSVGMKEYDIKSAPVIIEDDVWIGLNCTIMKGVTIGRGAIIGSGSMVTKDVKPWTVNVGNPLKCVRELEPVSVSNRTI